MLIVSETQDLSSIILTYTDLDVKVSVETKTNKYMRNIILTAAICLFALKTQANTVTLDSLKAGVASATAYVHGTVDSGEAQLIYQWDFLPNFLNVNYASGSIVSGVFATTDIIPYLPANYTLYFRAGAVQGIDTIWAPIFLQASILDTPVVPIFNITSTEPTLTGAIQTYYFNSGNVTATVKPYISYVGPATGFNLHEPFELNGEGNGSYLWDGIPPGFTFWCYFVTTNPVGEAVSTVFTITTLSEPAMPWISLYEFEAPPDSLRARVLVMGNSLPTTVTMTWSSSNGVIGAVVSMISGSNQLDTLWLETGGVGMESVVLFDICASNSMGNPCVGEMITTTNTKAFVTVDSFKATTWNHGVAYCTAHVPAGSVVNTGYILSKNENLLPITDQSDTMKIHYQTESYQIPLAGLYDQINYYLYVYGNATDGTIFDTLYQFQFDEAGVGVATLNSSSAPTLWCDGNTVTVNSKENQILTVSSVLGIVRETKISPGSTDLTYHPGFYSYKFSRGKSGKFLITH